MGKVAVFLFVLTVLCTLSFQQKQKEETTIYWSSGRPLTWSDFQIKKREIDGDAAITAAAIHSEMSTKLSEIKILCYFDKTKSWVCDKHQTIALLKHEQGHFDIAETFAMEFRRQVLSSSFTLNNIDRKYSKIKADIFSGMDKEQDLYDKETNHSQDSVKQVEWNKKISEDLEKLSQYVNDTVIHLKL